MLSTWGRLPHEVPWAAGVLIVACVFTLSLDLAYRRIPNYVTYATAGLGLALSIVNDTVGSSVLGLVAGVAILLPAFVHGKMGGGDVKFMGAVGAVGGFPFVLEALAYGFAVASVMAVWSAWTGGKFRRLLRGLGVEFGRLVGHVFPHEPAEVDLARIPLGVGLSIGALIALLERQYGLLGWVDPLYYLTHRVTS